MRDLNYTKPGTMTFTREQIEAVYDELDRRIDLDIADETLPNKARWIWDERASRLQGVYGTLMALATNKNWQDITWWISDIEEKRYGERVW